MFISQPNSTLDRLADLITEDENQVTNSGTHSLTGCTMKAKLALTDNYIVNQISLGLFPVAFTKSTGLKTDAKTDQGLPLC